MTSPNTIIADLAAEVESLKKQRDDLILAVADHVTVRCEYMRQRDELVKFAEEYLGQFCCYQITNTSDARHDATGYLRDLAKAVIANAKGKSC